MVAIGTLKVPSGHALQGATPFPLKYPGMQEQLVDFRTANVDEPLEQGEHGWSPFTLYESGGQELSIHGL